MSAGVLLWIVVCGAVGIVDRKLLCCWRFCVRRCSPDKNDTARQTQSGGMKIEGTLFQFELGRGGSTPIRRETGKRSKNYVQYSGGLP
jgi:hypothetical protein